MSHSNLDFHNKTEWYRGELAYAKQQRMIKEARRAGMKLNPAFSVQPLLTAMTQVTTWINSLIAAWSTSLRSRGKPIPVTGTIEDPSSSCS
jgi:hypothetical protein